MKIYNENEKYILHFMFSYKYLHIKFSWIHVMKNIKITYQVMGRQHITQNMVHDYKNIYIYIYIQVYMDYLIE